MTPVTTPKNGPNRLGRPLEGKAPGNFRLPDSRLRSIFVEPRAQVILRVLSRAGKDARRRDVLLEEFKRLAGALQSHRSAENWSERTLCAQINIPRSTWQRLLRDRHAIERWLPRLRAGAEKLKIDTHHE